MSPTITQQKRNQLLTFIERKLKPATAVCGVIGIGSIATGTMRAGSDIDAIILMDPFDLAVAPAEAIWMPTDDSFHSIFSERQDVQEEGFQFDFVRADMLQWANADYQLAEGRLYSVKIEKQSFRQAIFPEGVKYSLVSESSGDPFRED